MESVVFDNTTTTKDSRTDTKKTRQDYEDSFARLCASHHSQCLFTRQPSIIPGLQFTFDDRGVLHGEFTCNGYQQGYDNMVHGGVIAAIIDASMAQCLMGHGVICYTTDLSVRYKKPVKIRTFTTLSTTLVQVRMKCLYTMECKVYQNDEVVVTACGKFYKVE